MRNTRGKARPPGSGLPHSRKILTALCLVTSVTAFSSLFEYNTNKIAIRIIRIHDVPDFRGDAEKVRRSRA
jgi:hypothetical protein